MSGAEVGRQTGEEAGAEAGGPCRTPGVVGVGRHRAGNVDVRPGGAGDELVEEQGCGGGTGVRSTEVGDVGDVGVELLAVLPL